MLVLFLLNTLQDNLLYNQFANKGIMHKQKRDDFYRERHHNSLLDR